jgi:hypothetical protein
MTLATADNAKGVREQRLPKLLNIRQDPPNTKLMDYT